MKARILGCRGGIGGCHPRAAAFFDRGAGVLSRRRVEANGA